MHTGTSAIAPSDWPCEEGTHVRLSHFTAAKLCSMAVTPSSSGTISALLSSVAAAPALEFPGLPPQAWAAFDFGALPPEVNSTRMYSGPGPTSLLAAAVAWDALASELATAGSGYSSTIDELLAHGWSGPSSQAMIAALEPFVAWMRSMAICAELAGTQARAAVAAYETAFAITVPPPLVTANRVRLTTLISTNFFGQNLPAIAATEAEYAEFWAQDATAMFAYAHASANASMLKSFKSPPATTNPAGLAAQHSAAGSAAASTTAAHTAAIEATAIHATTQATAATSSGSSSGLTTSELNLIVNQTVGLSYFGMGLAQMGLGVGFFNIPTDLAPYMEAAGLPFPAGTAAIEGAAALAPDAAAVSATVGQSNSIGLLSTPPSWAAPGTDTGSGARLVSALTSSSGGSSPAVSRGPLGIPPLQGASRHEGSQLARRRYGIRYKVVPRPPGGG